MDKTRSITWRARHEFAGARHELLYETADVQIDMWRRIDSFLDGITGKG